jgi:hypothetical protein
MGDMGSNEAAGQRNAQMTKQTNSLLKSANRQIGKSILKSSH